MGGLREPGPVGRVCNIFPEAYSSSYESAPCWTFMGTTHVYCNCYSALMNVCQIYSKYITIINVL